MRVQLILARYLAGAGHDQTATVDKSSRLLEYDAAFNLFVEAFAQWAIEELQKSSHPQLSIQPGP